MSTSGNLNEFSNHSHEVDHSAPISPVLTPLEKEAEDLDALRRQREADIGVEACLTYMSRANSTSSQHCSPPLSPNLNHISYTSYPMTSTSLSQQSIQSHPASSSSNLHSNSIVDMMRTRSNSLASTYSSSSYSRPLTNDSLPSYKTNESLPPSPLLHGSHMMGLGGYRRPSLAPLEGVIEGKTGLIPAVPSNGERMVRERSYGYI